MWSVFVIDFYPSFSNFPYLLQGREQMGIEHFIAVTFVISFNKHILIRFSRLDLADLNAVFLIPVYKRLGAVFGPIVIAQ